jgi:hypothetical protein
MRELVGIDGAEVQFVTAFASMRPLLLLAPCGLGIVFGVGPCALAHATFWGSWRGLGGLLLIAYGRELWGVVPS